MGESLKAAQLIHFVVKHKAKLIACLIELKTTCRNYSVQFVAGKLTGTFTVKKGPQVLRYATYNNNARKKNIGIFSSEINLRNV